MKNIEVWQLRSAVVDAEEDGTVTVRGQVADEELALISILNSLSCLLGEADDDVEEIDVGQAIFRSPEHLRMLRDLFEQVRLDNPSTLGGMQFTTVA